VRPTLVMFCEYSEGVISVDGIDLRPLGLDDVRARDHGLCIIPQVRIASSSYSFVLNFSSLHDVCVIVKIGSCII
jgi:hypothetical protein